MKKPSLLAISHDAGGAEVLSSYLNHNIDSYGKLFCVAENLAVNIYRKKGFAKKLIDSDIGSKLISKGQVGLVITSTSACSDLERKFIRLAKKYSIKTVSMLEHWINYKKRFGYPKKNWRGNLPDEIWVLDKLARRIAVKEFGNLVVIKIKPNFYWQDLKIEYKKIKSAKNKKYFNILFLGGSQKGEDSVGKTAGLVNFLRGYKRRKPIFFKIRPHPTDKISGYQPLIRAEGLRVVLSNPLKDSLLKDFKRADLIIGVNSVALAIASFLGKRTACCVDENFPIWLDKFDTVQIKKDFKELAAILDKRINNKVWKT